MASDAWGAPALRNHHFLESRMSELRDSAGSERIHFIDYGGEARGMVPAGNLPYQFPEPCYTSRGKPQLARMQ